MHSPQFTSTFCSICFLFSATAFAADVPELNKDTFAKWRDFIRPSEKEVEYLKVPWRTNFAAALAEGRAKDKPIFLWNFHGHPLGCSCINGVHTKEVFENPQIKELSKMFITVAEDSGRLEFDRKYPAFELFHREYPQGSQGFFVFTPSGKMLGRSWYKPEEVASLLQECSAKWEKIPKSERDAMATGAAGKKEEDAVYPKDGLVLHSYMRDLPRKSGSPRKEWNQEFTWFTKIEARQFVPLKLKVGEQHEVPKAVLHRLVRFTFVDSVIGGTAPFAEGHVKSAKLNSRIVSLQKDAAHVEFDGESLAEEIGIWSIHEDDSDKGPQKRGCRFKIIGNADFSVSRQSFTSFELVACGDRWGGTRFNWRGSDSGLAPMGVACFLASKEPWEKIKPLRLEDYWPMKKRNN